MGKYKGRKSRVDERCGAEIKDLEVILNKQFLKASRTPSETKPMIEIMVGPKVGLSLT